MSIPGPGSSPSPLLGEAPLFSDGVGDRVVSSDPTTGELVQVLRINPALTAVPSFEFALRERVARLANFRHPYFARVRRVDRAPAQVTALALVSDHVVTRMRFASIPHRLSGRSQPFERDSCFGRRPLPSRGR